MTRIYDPTRPRVRRRPRVMWSRVKQLPPWKSLALYLWECVCLAAIVLVGAYVLR